MRITRHQMFMQIAEVVARRSTCYRRNVGAVLVRDKNIVSIGYNGPPPGEPHCTGTSCPTNNVCTRALHAETNAIIRCEDPHSGLTMYVTESPCVSCAAYIANWKRIHALYFMHPYRDPAGVEYLATQIPVFRMTPAGDVIDHTTKEFVR
jgi:dCMP deaminase